MAAVVARTGYCPKCTLFTWVRIDSGLCTQPPYSCHFELPGEMPEVSDNSEEKNLDYTVD